MFGFFRRKENVFQGLIEQQAALAYEGLRLLVKYFETSDPDVAEELSIKEKEADEVYLKGLAMMDDYKKLSKVTIDDEEAPLGLTEILELPPLSKAEPEQLIELADLLLADADLLTKEQNVGTLT